LGQLVREFKRFITPSEPPITIEKSKSSEENNILNQLKQNLSLLVKKRNQFAHKLFSLGKDVSTLADEAQEGIKVANKTLALLESLENKLKGYET